MTGHALRAGTITLLSGASTGCTSLNYATAGACNDLTFDNVAIANPASPWATDPGGAVWISFEQTGVGGIVLPNDTTLGSPNATFYLTFAGGAGVTGSVTVWADDTAGVYIDGTLLAAPSLDQSTLHDCSTGITCAGAGTTLAFSAPEAMNTLEFQVYQVGLAEYGLMYDATINYPGGVPEPGSYLLLATGLFALTLLRKRPF